MNKCRTGDIVRIIFDLEKVLNGARYNPTLHIIAS